MLIYDERTLLMFLNVRKVDAEGGLGKDGTSTPTNIAAKFEHNVAKRKGCN